jgi:UDP-N-acetylglucosamine--N-acetylmuramyl-(pentapeptide) pyrophosphoryl-undecaprenol N-acetylglucosamine transferase
MFPAASLAHDLLSRGYKVALVTDKRGSKFAANFGDIPVHIVNAGTLGSGVLNKIKGVAAMGAGRLQAGRLIEKLSPDLVVGFGGYPSVPAMHAAQSKNIPTIIHEQNAVLGKANAFLAPKAERIALSIPYSGGVDKADAVRTVITGNPVRTEIADLYTKPYPALERDGVLKIFVLGGSLGASIFSDVVPKALKKLSAADRARLDIVQQCRPEDIDAVREIYSNAGIKARLETFFDDVAEQLSACHLVIARSGASTVAEVTVAGRPAIFVPAGFHSDNQQSVNAENVEDAKGAWIMVQSGFTEEALLARVENFLQNPEILFRAAEASRGCGKPDATRRLGNLITAMVSGWGNEGA